MKWEAHKIYWVVNLVPIYPHLVYLAGNGTWRSIIYPRWALSNCLCSTKNYSPRIDHSSSISSIIVRIVSLHWTLLHLLRAPFYAYINISLEIYIGELLVVGSIVDCFAIDAEVSAFDIISTRVSNWRMTVVCGCVVVGTGDSWM